MKDVTGVPHVLGEPTYEGLARYIEWKNVRKIVVMAGAGISVAAGIPDFRSPNKGVYANLEEYNLSSPTDAFSMSLLRDRPEVFYNIVKEMDLWPGRFWPTLVHHFIKLLADEGRLLRCYTQNIDGLERLCGVPESLLVEAHGSFSSASCVVCHSKYDIERAFQEAMEGKIPRCDKCGGVAKPDIVFFGENLPESFLQAFEDMKEAELLLIMGTSLQVHPFAELVVDVRPHVPRVLFNMERVGGMMFRFPTDTPVKSSRCSKSRSGSGDRNDGSISTSDKSDDINWCEVSSGASDGICRDVFFSGDCQVSVWRLAEAMKLGEKLEAAICGSERERKSK